MHGGGSGGSDNSWGIYLFLFIVVVLYGPTLVGIMYGW
jgi:hypothetical protein